MLTGASSPDERRSAMSVTSKSPPKENAPMRTVKIAAASVLMATALYGCSKGGEAPAPQAPPVTVALPTS